MPKWTFSGQNGVPGHCMVAQVWKDGLACIEVEPTVDPAEATETARQVAQAMNHFQSMLAEVELFCEIASIESPTTKLGGWDWKGMHEQLSGLLKEIKGVE